MKWLQEQWEKSNLISGLLALAIWGGIITLSLMQAPIPDILYAGGMGVIGFFFGAKIGSDSGERKALVRMVDTKQEVRRG